MTRSVFRTIAALTLLAFLAPFAWAAGTAAGTNVNNIATATYIDSAGIARTTQSNQVVTVVQQVYSLAIVQNSLDGSGNPTSTEANVVTFSAKDVADEAGTGDAAFFPYVITNTGNGSDTFALNVVQGTNDQFDATGLIIYRDADCDGVLDAGETAITSITLAADASACLLLRATVPAGPTEGDASNLNLTGTSNGAAAVGQTVTDTDNWSQLTFLTQADIELSKAPSNPSPAPGDTVSYTITGTNAGGQAAGEVTGVITVDAVARDGILVRDILPTGPTFAGFTGNTMPLGVTAEYVYSTDGGTTWTATPPSPLSTVNAVAILLTDGAAGTNPTFFPSAANGGTFTVTFEVVVPDPALAGTTFDNFADIRFDATGDGDGDDTGEVGTASVARLTVATVYGVSNGPNGFPDGNATGSYTSGGYTIVTTGDTSTIATAYSGNTLSFVATIENTGNALDTFSLALAGVPAGFTCTVYDSTGATVITQVVVDAYSTVNVVVSCTIDPTFTETDPNVDAATITLTATSQNDPGSVSDPTTFVVKDVLDGFSVNIGNSDQNKATPPSDTPVTKATTPGTTVLFPIEILNDGQNPDSYDLTASLPAGWTDGIYPDANCDGVPDQTTSPVTNTGTLAVGETACFVVLATPPVGTAPADYNVTISAASTTQPGEVDSITNVVTVQEVVAFLFSPDRTGTTTSPGEIIYTHTLTNNGNTTATVSIPPNAPQGSFSYAYSLDGTTFSTSLSGVTVAPNGGTQTVYVRVRVLDGVADQTSNSVTVTANATFASGATATDSVTDTTTIFIGVMAISKTAKTFDGAFPAPTDCASTTNVTSADGSETRPGDYLCYTITASNTGSANLRNLKVADPISSFTTFVSASATKSGFPTSTVLWSTNGTTWSSIVPGTVASGATIYAGVDTNSDATISTLDTMPPGATLVVTLVVRVK